METSLLSRWWKLPRSIRVAAITVILGVAFPIALSFILPSCYSSFHWCGIDRRQVYYSMGMRSTLRYLAVAESLYFSEHRAYTANLDTLARLDPYLLSDIMTIEIDRADAVGWHASVAHPAITQTCSFGANGPPTSRPDAAELRQFCSEDWEYRTGPE